jgi:nitroimidazol reductase NimA-like FMN-containing flavoprotein (pyridoxamine 5'-phosphate oxidase superfamily)
MPKLSPDEVDAFLDERGHLLRVATVDADGHPSVVPIWFVRVGDDILFTPRGPSVFLANIRRDPRVGLSIDEDALPYRKVTVRGVRGWCTSPATTTSGATCTGRSRSATSPTTRQTPTSTAPTTSRAH